MLDRPPNKNCRELHKVFGKEQAEGVIKDWMSTATGTSAFPRIDVHMALLSFYAVKKRKWASTRSYYAAGQLWGESYGYNLKPAYSGTEIEQFETRHNIVLPVQFRQYLLNVSRELFVGSYPVEIRLGSEDFGSCKIADGVDYQEEEDDIDFEDGMIMIGNDGCTEVTNLVIKGKHVGSIWRIGDGGCCIHRCNGDFNSFILQELNKVRFW